MPDNEPTLDPKEALTHIKTLARAALNSDEVEVAQRHLEMILALVDKALPQRKRLGT